jgi:hypothetical protein
MRRAAKAVVASATLISGCGGGEKAAESVQGALISTGSPSPDNPELLRKISLAQPSSDRGLVEAWYRREKPTEIAPRDEFETSGEYARRSEGASARKMPPTGCVAFVEDIDFSYDADQGRATFTRESVPAHIMGTVEAASTHRIGRVSLAPSGVTAPGQELNARITADYGRELRERSSPAEKPLRVAYIIAPSARDYPLLRSSVPPSIFFDYTHRDLMDGTQRFKDAVDSFHRAQISLTARPVRVIIFDPQRNGAEKPIHDWRANETRC